MGFVIHRLGKLDKQTDQTDRLLMRIIEKGQKKGKERKEEMLVV